MVKTLLIAGIVFGGLGVVLGAFGAHRLEGKLTPDQADILDKAVRYQFIHALAIIGVVLSYGKMPFSTTLWAGSLFLAGIILFSGSLYLWSMRDLLGIGSWRFLVFLTPLGGTAFIAGWISWLVSAIKWQP